jgi:16S rRNA (guanine527-N7)-methyltransferase
LVADLLPARARVVDVGSGAGLPGLVLAIRRPDLAVDLVEPMSRRVEFLQEAVLRLGVGDRVRTVRGRADEPAVVDLVGAAEWVTARAVAPLSRLVPWCFPLLGPGGTLLAIKGAGAADEVAAARRGLQRLGISEIAVHKLGEQVATDPTWVVSVRRDAATRSSRGRRGRS